LTANTFMRVHVLKHVASEGVGSMKEWFLNKGDVITTTRVDLHQSLPDINEIDWLIIMGGPMSVYEEEEFSWLKPEKQFIRQVIENNKHVLGICLGGQLIASAMGAKVYANNQQEIGWFPINKTNDIASWLPSELNLLCWHGDCFELPQAAVSFATSEITRHQGFCLGPRIWALQFHIEAQEGTTEVFYRVTGLSLPQGNFVQSLEALSSTGHLATSKETVFELLDFMLAH
jgi:GMP synthase-like glutamine amidotransferase